MKALSYTLVVTALLATAPAMANDGNIGVNQFHGSDTLASYAAEPSHASPVQEAIRRAAAEASARPQRNLMVWGDRAVDPIYAEPAPAVGVAHSAPVQAETAFGGTDFALIYAN
ncbi:hypothetical protein [Arenibaculum pallidiluteum]|uniref:hypothetical protein n=1 Tax=Arenibaculum pallidiluteum TaxID=2812559 RepID=UPI001A9699AF|nr:hypothetical protein [Arenibaculum pallidiluteum]